MANENTINDHHTVPISGYPRFRWTFSALSRHAQTLALVCCKKSQVRSLGHGARTMTRAEATFWGVPPHRWVAVVTELQTFAGVGLGNFAGLNRFVVPLALAI